MLGKTTDEAQMLWDAAGFKPQKLNTTVGPKNYVVGRETVAGTPGNWDGTFQSCGNFRLTIAP